MKDPKIVAKLIENASSITKLIETASSVKFGLSRRSTTSYNMSICSTGGLRVEAVKNYIRKCGISEPYELRYPMIDRGSDAFPVRGGFLWAKATGEGLFSNKIKYVPAAEDKEWIKRKLIQKYSEDPTAEASEGPSEETAAFKPGSP